MITQQQTFASLEYQKGRRHRRSVWKKNFWRPSTFGRNWKSRYSRNSTNYQLGDNWSTAIITCNDQLHWWEHGEPSCLLNGINTKASQERPIWVHVWKLVVEKNLESSHRVQGILQWVGQVENQGIFLWASGGQNDDACLQYRNKGNISYEFYMQQAHGLDDRSHAQNIQLPDGGQLPGDEMCPQRI